MSPFCALKNEASVPH